MPLGRTTYDRVMIYFGSDEAGVDLYIGNFGYTLSDPTKTYSFMNIRVNLDGWLELKWDNNRGWWIIVDHHNADLPNFIPGITCYNFEFTQSYLSDFIAVGANDLFIEITEDLETNQTMELLLQTPSYTGIRARISINFNSDPENEPRLLHIYGSMVRGSVEASGIQFSLSGHLLLEWSMSLNSWLVVDMSPHAFHNLNGILLDMYINFDKPLSS